MKQRCCKNIKYRIINRWEECNMKKVMIVLAALAAAGVAVTGCIFRANTKVYGNIRYR